MEPITLDLLMILVDYLCVEKVIKDNLEICPTQMSYSLSLFQKSLIKYKMLHVEKSTLWF